MIIFNQIDTGEIDENQELNIPTPEGETSEVSEDEIDEEDVDEEE